MARTRELFDLARELAEIAGKTTDADTAHGLLELIEELMVEIGLPPLPDDDPPNRH